MLRKSGILLITSYILTIQRREVCLKPCFNQFRTILQYHQSYYNNDSMSQQGKFYIEPSSNLLAFHACMTQVDSDRYSHRPTIPFLPLTSNFHNNSSRSSASSIPVSLGASNFLLSHKVNQQPVTASPLQTHCSRGPRHRIHRSFNQERATAYKHQSYI